MIDNIKDFIEEKHYNYTFNEWLKKQIFARDKEIERLKEEYVMLQNASDEVEEEKDREIERLNNIIKETINILDKWCVLETEENTEAIIDLAIETLKEGSDKK